MRMYLVVALVVMASFIPVGAWRKAPGLWCHSDCAACWKDNDPNGVDIKFTCDDEICGWTCPDGYHGLHCAKNGRCV